MSLRVLEKQNLLGSEAGKRYYCLENLMSELDVILNDNVPADSGSIPAALKKVEDAVRRDPDLAMKLRLTLGTVEAVIRADPETGQYYQPTLKEVEDFVWKDPALIKELALFSSVVKVVGKCFKAAKSPEDKAWKNGQYGYSVAYFMRNATFDRTRALNGASRAINRKIRVRAKTMANLQSNEMMKLNEDLGRVLGKHNIVRNPASWDINETYAAAVQAELPEAKRTAQTGVFGEAFARIKKCTS